MKLANHGGRLALVVDGGALDVHEASGGRFGPDPASAYADWDALRAWAATADGDPKPLDQSALGAPSPSPARCSPSASTTPATRPSRGWRCPPFRRCSPRTRRRSAAPSSDTVPVGPMAARAGVPLVVLTHLIPPPDRPGDADGFADDLRAGGYPGRITVGDDLTTVTLPGRP